MFCDIPGMSHKDIINQRIKAFDQIRKIEPESVNTRQKIRHVFLSACDEGYVEVVKYMNDNGADLKLYGNKALKYASRTGKIDVVKYLVDCGITPKKASESGLNAAAYNGHLETVKYLVDNIDDIDYSDNRDDNTTLSNACERGHLEIVKYLIEKGGARPRRNNSLYQACVNGHLKIVKYLIKNRYASVHDRSALYGAGEKNHIDIVKFLMRWSYKHNNMYTESYIKSLNKMIADVRERYSDPPVDIYKIWLEYGGGSVTKACRS